MLKGHTKIELTNVHTGKKEVVEKHNIVTNAIQDMLKTYGIYSPAIFGNGVVCSNFDIKSCYGGLITWDGTIEENQENYKFKPYGVNAGAHAACDFVNAGTDPLLGSYNSVESEITNNSAKFVYDFTTSQGNGVISCITLVSQENGYAGFNGISGISSYVDARVPNVLNGFNNMIPFPSENKLISVDKLLQRGTTPTITITEYDALLSNTFSLFKGTAPVKTSETTLGITDLCDYTDPKLMESDTFPIYYDDTTKTISVVLYEPISNAVNEVTIATINVLTREITKQKVNIPSWGYSDIYGLHYKNYLIYGTEDKMSIMNLTTGQIGSKTISINTAYSGDIRKQIYPLNEYEFLYWHDYSYINAFPRLLVNLKDMETKELSCSRYIYPNVGYSFLPGHPLYFGTINNLDAPVTKTADKTMKIIYTLTET